MKTTISCLWQGNLAFVSTVGDHQVRTDAGLAVGGENSGASPKMLMMVALAGCSGVDVAAILRKMQVPVSTLAIVIEGELTDDIPAVFSAMHIVYRFTGSNLAPAKLRRAIELSMDKYCGVSAMYRKIMDITWEIEIVDEGGN
jgi:putative redox protein